MRIKKILNGPFATNSYLLERKEECVVIDPGLEKELMVKEIKGCGKALTGIIGTHCHPDHIGAVSFLKKEFGAPFYLHIDEKPYLGSFKEIANFIGIFDVEVPVVDVFIKSEGKLEVGGFAFEVIHTPGHTPGSVSLLLDGVLFTGDTLFSGSVGRVDLPGGSQEELYKSLEKLCALDDDLKVYPGHGQDSVLGYEKKFNPFLREVLAR
ncbi:MAG: MBL fold metallo-hydrolase [Candidatus Marinimicrobia bacterium]|nr:MBL fold metallo-hydrolase [Candidatus Neomarinimicrobiota bacterium]